jgi:hypothetical protein
MALTSLFVWLVADGWCWFVLREKYCWLVASGWFVVREKYCWLVADKPSEQTKHRQAGPGSPDSRWWPSDAPGAILSLAASPAAASVRPNSLVDDHGKI